jgi:hypothetical protein
MEGVSTIQRIGRIGHDSAIAISYILLVDTKGIVHVSIEKIWHLNL